MQTHRREIHALCAFLMILAMTTFFGSARARAQADEEQVTITFEERNDSGASGTATLTAVGNQTRVELDITGLTGHHPDHIHRSTCEDPEPNPLFPLTDVVLDRADETGHSETLVDVPLADLLAEPHVILIHKSMAEINIYVACADILATGTAGQGGDATGIPDTGVGTIAGTDPLGGPSQLALVLLAMILALAGIRLARSSRS